MNLSRIISRNLPTILLLLLCRAAHAQVNSGSNGSDGAFNPTTNIVINMADHPTGIYHYTSVNIPSGVTVTFIPNANNTPVVWLVQSNVIISGTLILSGQHALATQRGIGGPGGWNGGNGGPAPTSGQGPGGGSPINGFASRGTFTYGNVFLVPLLGGSGGGGTASSLSNGTILSCGGGGGGAFLVAAANSIVVDGIIAAQGGNGYYWGGGGSGGGVRFVASRVAGVGTIDTTGGQQAGDFGSLTTAGYGHIRFDTHENTFGGQIRGNFTQGFQPIIIPSASQLPQLTVTSVGGVPVSASPTGTLSTPDAVLSAQQNNPISVVVHCSNIPLNTQITVSVKPANGATVSATGLNNTGTLASSTATILINMPRGGGIIYATAATGN